jgi:IS1 family transposase
MANFLKQDRQKQVLHTLLEGSSIRSTERLTGVHRDTICRLLVNFGQRCREFMDSRLRGLTLDHIEVDEIWTFVAKKQARLTPDEKAECFDVGDMYLWTCLDAETKLVASFLVGKRSADNARRLMKDLASRLVFPGSHASDPHAWQAGGYIQITQISTDGFSAYPEAVDLAFGPYAKYGQIIKDYRNANQPGRYAPPEMVGTERKAVYGLRPTEEWTICTSHVERHNLTIRTLMKRFTRLCLGFSKKLENLEAACAMFLAYYNFYWRTRKPGTSGRYRVPAAMAAGVVPNLWTFEDLFQHVMSRYNSGMATATDSPILISEALKTKDAIIRELVATAKNLGAQSDLLAIGGSYGETMTDNQILRMLREWNSYGPVEVATSTR